MSLTGCKLDKLSSRGSVRLSARHVEGRAFDERTPLSASIGDATEPGKHSDAPERLSRTLVVTVLVATVGSSLQFGYGTGVLNNAQTVIFEYFHGQGKEYSTVQWGATVSSYGIGGLIGSLLGPKVIGNYCGRRDTLLINNVFLLISSCLIVYAPVWWWQAVGRVFSGIVAGVATGK
jgi:Sugar (and other) transporter